ncbi:hypothetical protein NWT09_15085 [Mycolicibacterium sp. jd]|uniref:hypothetical protein n=1 Tax=unclassified Mycolicibacterium TaxID=2636767 RepID=UPI00351B52E9
MADTRRLYDPSTPEFQTEIWYVYRRMRNDHPVYRDPDGQFYALTRFADVWAAAADHETFSSRVEEANDLLPQLIYIDPPRHAALRKLVSRVFTARRVAAMEDEIRTCITGLLDGIAARGSCEFQHDYAAVIPSVVVGGMIGLDEQYLAPMRTWTEEFIGPADTGAPPRGSDEHLCDVRRVACGAAQQTARRSDDRAAQRRDRRRAAHR